MSCCASVSFPCRLLLRVCSETASFCECLCVGVEEELERKDCMLKVRARKERIGLGMIDKLIDEKKKIVTLTDYV